MKSDSSKTELNRANHVPSPQSPAWDGPKHHSCCELAISKLLLPLSFKPSLGARSLSHKSTHFHMKDCAPEKRKKKATPKWFVGNIKF